MQFNVSLMSWVSPPVLWSDGCSERSCYRGHTSTISRFAISGLGQRKTRFSITATDQCALSRANDTIVWGGRQKRYYFLRPQQYLYFYRCCRGSACRADLRPLGRRQEARSAFLSLRRLKAPLFTLERGAFIGTIGQDLKRSIRRQRMG